MIYTLLDFAIYYKIKIEIFEKLYFDYDPLFFFFFEIEKVIYYQAPLMIIDLLHVGVFFLLRNNLSLTLFLSISRERTQVWLDVW